ncbi:MAG: transposase [Candidatus Microthrix sp.]|nr:transposase [Candidatus Microthrix sp.]
MRSSLTIEKHCHDSVAFRSLAATQQPDFRSVARLRERYVEPLEDLFETPRVWCTP